MKRQNLLIAIGLATIYFILLASTLDMGFPRDESFYFLAGEQYSHWFDELVHNPAKAFTKKSVNKHFAFNPEHVALPKIMFGLSWRLFGKISKHPRPGWYNGPLPKPILGWFRESTAMRLPVLVLNAFLIFMVFLFGATYLSRRAGLGAALVMMLMPRFFWHAHLACFDAPVTVMWFATAYAFFKSERDGWKWAVLTGIVWGLALSTKLNAYFIPATLVLYWLTEKASEFHIRAGDKKGTWLSIPRIPMAFFFMLLLAPVVYFALWPKLWFDPMKQLKWYFNRHMHHEYYWAYYFGTLYVKPPFPVAFPFVMSAMTIPAPSIVLFVVGALAATRDAMARWWFGLSRRMQPLIDSFRAPRPYEPGVYAFLFWNMLIPFAIIAMPKVPIFGGTKHWFPGLPFLALFAGIGFERVLGAIESVFPGRRMLLILAGLMLFTSPFVDTLRHHADNSAYYNNFVGGYWAMGDLKMEREFWGNSSYGVLPYLDKYAKAGAVVDFHDTTWNAVQMYYRDHLLRPDIRAQWDYDTADFFLFHIHKEFLDLEAKARHSFGDPPPATGVYVDGVALLHLYQRKGATKRTKRVMKTKRVIRK